MYTYELIIHSYLRWFIVIIFSINLFSIYYGYLSNRVFNKYDLILNKTTVSLLHIQFIVGMFLYYKSPIVETFFENTKDYMKIADLRFFAIEHSITMLLSIILLTIGFSISKREQDSKSKFKILMKFYSVSFLLIFISIPWEFSPYVQRISLR